MGIADTRRKGLSIKEIHGNYVLVLCGVDIKNRAVHGVGFDLHSEEFKCIIKTNFISERIIHIRFKRKQKNNQLHTDV